MYNVVAKRTGIGSFSLSYGRGSKRLGAVVNRTDDGWRIVSGDFPSPRLGVDNNFACLKYAKEQWGKWARQKYENPNGPTPLQELNAYFPDKPLVIEDVEYTEIVDEEPLEDIINTPSHTGDEWPVNRHDRCAFERLVGIYGKDFLRLQLEKA
jgi:hypothetical protein